jgi:6-phosphogluconolactonase
MSLTKIGRGAAAAMMSLAMGFGLTACTRDYTVAYVYATTAPKNGAGGGVAEYAVDYQSGSLVGLTGSPIAAGNNPTGIVAAPNGLFVYVLNHDDSTVQEFAVGTDGKLTSKNTYPLTGSSPSAANVDPTGKFLYVTYTYQPGYSATNPGPGGVSIFPINADNSLGTVINQNLGNNPVGIATNGFNNYVYIVDQETPTSGVVLAFTRDASTGALTPVPGTTIGVPGGTTVTSGIAAGVKPSAITEDPRGHFVYVTDQAANQLYGYVVQNGGALLPMVNGPFSTGLFPVAVTVDPRGLYLYVANYNANTVSAYAINQASGTPAGTVGSGAVGVGTAPISLAIEPALGIYLFVANNLDGTISGQQLDPHNGSLKAVENTPFPASGLPTGVVAVANGSHATQIVQP